MGQLVTIAGPNGAQFTVDSDYAQAFQQALQMLQASGTDVDASQSGGYANRNIAGTNVPSAHSRGQAIDINWTDNPVGDSGGGLDDPARMFRVVRPEQAQQIAAATGLEWGGNWRSPFDPMHFQVPRQGLGNAPLARRTLVAASGSIPMARQQTQQAPLDDPTAVMDLLMPPGAGVKAPSSQSAAQPAMQQAQVAQGTSAPDVRASGDASGQWGPWLQNPVNRAFMLQMGIQLMTPTWGGPMAQLAAGIGAGAEAAAGTQRVINEEDRALREMDFKASQAELDRKNKIQIAQMGADSRSAVANIRGQYALERAKASGAKTNPELTAYMQAFRSRMAVLEQNNILRSPPLSEEEMRADAEQTATAALNAARAATGGARPAGSPAGGTEGVAPAPAGGPAGQTRAPAASNGRGGVRAIESVATPTPADETAQPGQIGTVGKGTVEALTRGRFPAGTPVGAPPAAPAAPAQQGRTSFEQAMQNPVFVQNMQTPEGRQRILQLRPDFAPQVQMWEAMQVNQAVQ